MRDRRLASIDAVAVGDRVTLMVDGRLEHGVIVARDGADTSVLLDCGVHVIRDHQFLHACRHVVER